jgi:hypothetical protein
MASTTEHERLQKKWESHVPWRKWGPYSSERQWGDFCPSVLPRWWSRGNGNVFRA